METKVEHLIVRSIQMVDVRDWSGLGAFNCGEPSANAVESRLTPADGTLAVQALVKAEYGPAVKPRPTDGVTLHLLMHPEHAPRIGEILRITIESMPAGGWPGWANADKDHGPLSPSPRDLYERELVEKDCDLALPGGRRVSDALG